MALMNVKKSTTGSENTSQLRRADKKLSGAAKRNFLRRTKATAPPDTTEVETATIDNIETTTNKYTKRGGSKFKNRKEVEQKQAARNDTGGTEKNEFENRTRRPSFSSGARRSERPTATRSFVRKRLGGANVTIAPTASTSGSTLSTSASTKRPPFRIALANRRRPFTAGTSTTSTTSTTPATTTLGSEESLQDIGDIDAIEDPSLEPRTQKKTPKIQRRPLVALKEELTDQNPSATSEDEGKRQSKKYSSTFKQNQLDDLLRIKSQEEATTTGGTTQEEYNAETALAIATHQLITAPLPNTPDSDEDIKTIRTQTTQEYKYTSPEYTVKPTYEEYPSTAIYKINENQDYVQTTAGNTFSISSEFDAPKISSTVSYENPKSTLTDDFSTLSEQSETSLDFDSLNTNFDIPKTTISDDFSATLSKQIQYSSIQSGYSSPQPFTDNFEAPKTTLTDDYSTTRSRPGYSSTSTDYDSKITNTNLDALTTTTDDFSTTRSRRPGYTGIPTDYDSKITTVKLDDPKPAEAEGFSTIRSRRPGYSSISTDYEAKITTLDTSKTTDDNSNIRSRRPGYIGIQTDYDSKITTTNVDAPTTIDDFSTTRSRQPGYLGISTDYDSKITTANVDIPTTIMNDGFSTTRSRRPGYNVISTDYDSKIKNVDTDAPTTTLSDDISATRPRRPGYSGISTDYDSKITNIKVDSSTTLTDGLSTIRSRRPGYSSLSTDYDSKITTINSDVPKTTISEDFSSKRSRRPGYNSVSANFDLKIKNVDSDAPTTTFTDDISATRSRRPGYSGLSTDYDSKITTTKSDVPKTTISEDFSSKRSRRPGYNGVSADFDLKINVDSDALTTLTDDISSTRSRRPGYSSVSNEYDSKVTTTDFDAPKTTLTADFTTTRSRGPGYTGIPTVYDSKIETGNFDVPKTTATLSRYPTTSYQTVTNQYIQTTDDFTENPTEFSSSKIPAGFTLTSSAQPNDLRLSSLSIVTPGYSGIKRGSSTRYLSSTEKYVTVPAEGSSSAGSASSSQEPSYFTREYLLESPVTKTYDDEYQYLLPSTTPQTTTRKLVRKKIQRKISTTLRPTTPAFVAPVTTPKPRRVASKKPFEKVPKVPNRTYRPVVNYDYYDDSAEKVAEKYAEGTKVIIHGKGSIECLDVGNFPHPTSCKKFISCARMEFGALLGWEYVCPKGLSFDPVGGICNWSAGLGCNEKDI